LAQNEMKAKAGMPEHVSSNEGLGRIRGTGGSAVLMRPERGRGGILGTAMPKAKRENEGSRGQERTAIAVARVAL
jgi:hypothetical protein